MKVNTPQIPLYEVSFWYQSDDCYDYGLRYINAHSKEESIKLVKEGKGWRGLFNKNISLPVLRGAKSFTAKVLK